MPETKERAPIGGSRETFGLVTVSTPIPAQDLRAFLNHIHAVEDADEVRVERRAREYAGATLGHTLADHVKSSN